MNIALCDDDGRIRAQTAAADELHCGELVYTLRDRILECQAMLRNDSATRGAENKEERI